MASSRDLQATQSLPREARESIEAVFDALSAWRDEVGASTERYSETVLDKMAAATRALGWPKELVEASHKHLAQASKMQMHVIDQLMDAWQKQLTSPTADQFLAQLRTLPSAGFGASDANRFLDASSRDVAAQLGIGTVDVGQSDFGIVTALMRALACKVREKLPALMSGRDCEFCL